MSAGTGEMTPTWEPSGLKEGSAAHPIVAVRTVRIMGGMLFLGDGKIEASLKGTRSLGGA